MSENEDTPKFLRTLADLRHRTDDEEGDEADEREPEPQNERAAEGGPAEADERTEPLPAPSRTKGESDWLFRPDGPPSSGHSLSIPDPEVDGEELPSPSGNLATPGDESREEGPGEETGEGQSELPAPGSTEAALDDQEDAGLVQELPEPDGALAEDGPARIRREGGDDEGQRSDAPETEDEDERPAIELADVPARRKAWPEPDHLKNKERAEEAVQPDGTLPAAPPEANEEGEEDGRGDVDRSSVAWLESLELDEAVRATDRWAAVARLLAEHLPTPRSRPDDIMREVRRTERFQALDGADEATESTLEDEARAEPVPGDASPTDEADEAAPEPDRKAEAGDEPEPETPPPAGEDDDEDGGWRERLAMLWQTLRKWLPVRSSIEEVRRARRAEEKEEEGEGAGSRRRRLLIVAASFAIGVAGGGLIFGGNGSGGGSTGPDPRAPRWVHFVLTPPERSGAFRSVEVVGDFNGWGESPTAMTPVPGGGALQAWVRLPPGTHEYAFELANGTRIADPLYGGSMMREGISTVFVPEEGAPMARPNQHGQASPAGDRPTRRGDQTRNGRSVVAGEGTRTPTGGDG